MKMYCGIKYINFMHLNAHHSTVPWLLNFWMGVGRWNVVIILNEYSYLNYYFWENLFLKSTVSVPHPVPIGIMFKEYNMILENIYFVYSFLLRRRLRLMGLGSERKLEIRWFKSQFIIVCSKVTECKVPIILYY